MKRLFKIDGQDYEGLTNVYQRDATRAIIIKGKQIAVLYSQKEGYYKFLGGGIEKDENNLQALYREVLEECGKKISLATVTPFGFVEEKYRSQIVENELFQSVSYYYFVEFEEGGEQPKMNEHEKKQELVFTYCDLQVASEVNRKYWERTKNKMIFREWQVMLLLIQQIYK